MYSGNYKRDTSFNHHWSWSGPSATLRESLHLFSLPPPLFLRVTTVFLTSTRTASLWKHLSCFCCSGSGKSVLKRYWQLSSVTRSVQQSSGFPPCRLLDLKVEYWKQLILRMEVKLSTPSSFLSLLNLYIYIYYSSVLYICIYNYIFLINNVFLKCLFKGDGDVVWVTECPPSMRESLGLIPSAT